MSEVQQGQVKDGSGARVGEKRLPVQVSPTEVRYFTHEELEKSITPEDIQRGLDLAGAWSDLNISEEQFFSILERHRHEAEPTQPVTPE